MKKFISNLRSFILEEENVYQTIAQSFLFNPSWYKSRYHDVKKAGVDPIHHYLRHGAKEGRDPSSHFSTLFYVNTYPEILNTGLNPLFHYLKIGKFKDWKIRPSNTKKIISPFFDVDFYLENYPDIEREQVDPIDHYFLYGWKEGRDPSPDFSTSYYLNKYSDVAKSNLNPFVHYILFGKRENRQVTEQKRQIDDSDYHILDEHIDKEFYFDQYPDLINGLIDPAEHYMIYGWKEGRDPSPNFSTKYYLDSNPDIAKSRINPFLHYILFGKIEGRRPKIGSYELPFREGANILQNYALESMLLETNSPGKDIEKTINSSRLDIHWVIPDFNIGSGGHMTLFRMVHYLEHFGHSCTIWICDPIQHNQSEIAYNDIVKYFQPILAKVKFIDPDFFETQGDVIFATGWQTAYIVNNANGFKAKYYFVQDHEVEFYATGAMSLACKETYNLDFGCICASPWLKQLMEEEYNRWAAAFYLAYNHSEYFPAENWEENLIKDEVRIAVYARNTTERRAVSLALAGLQHLSHLSKNFSVDFYGQDKIMLEEVPFKARDHGILNSKELCALYQNCQVGLCFSSTNYSLVPQEMMACKLPVVELDTESTRAIFPQGTVTFAGPHPVHIATKLLELIGSPNRRLEQAARAFEWVSKFTWKSSAKKVEQGIKDYLEFQEFQIINRSTAVKSVDIVIPTYNGGELLKEVVDKIRVQKSQFHKQIICIDSSSTDGTNEWLKSQKDIYLNTIDQKEFQHGRTRNIGASLGHSDFIVFITQDALPANNFWLHYLVGMLDRYPGAAGVFGRHLPYPEHSIFIKHEINQHFKKFNAGPISVSKHTDLSQWNLPKADWRNYLHFYSDNNSCMRRSIWEKIPYPEVDYGEDQLWAQRIIDEGFQKIYAHHGSVFHSHDFSPEEMYKRCEIESNFFKTHFGYILGPKTNEELESILAHLNNHTRNISKKYQPAQEDIEHQLKLNEMKVKGWLYGHQNEN